MVHGGAAALAVLGYGPDSPLVVDAITVTPEVAATGGKVRIEASLTNPTDAVLGALVDVGVHFEMIVNGDTRGTASFELRS